jgi:hypothetical protein
MVQQTDIGIYFELHNEAAIEACFSKGLDPNALFQGRPLIDALIGEYTRSPRFNQCVQLFVQYGLRFAHPALLAVLTNDASKLDALLSENAELVHEQHTLPCAYTPMRGVTLLHICAEFNHKACAEVLMQRGADVNALAGTDSFGFGGQTPIFHTVNQNGNQSAEMLTFLLEQGADPILTVRGLIWGEGYPWETLIPAVNPVSYAMMGLLPQMHRDELTISRTVTLLLNKAFGIPYTPKNVPCAYLRQ